MICSWNNSTRLVSCRPARIKHNRFQQLLREERYDELTAEMKPVRHEDLRFVDKGDFLVVRIDIRIFQCGTLDELFTAERQQKPIFLLVEGGKQKCPTWLFAAVPHEYMFDNVIDLALYLKKLDDGEVSLRDEWVLFDTKGE